MTDNGNGWVMRDNATHKGAAETRGRRHRRWRVSAALGLTAVLAGGAIAALRTAGSPAPAPSQPAAAIASHAGRLTPDESRAASRIAVDAATRPGTAPARGGQDAKKDARKDTGSGERNAAGGSGAEPLDTRRPPRAKSASSAPDGRAEVQLYDYASDTLITRLVDLRAGTVLDSARQRGVQPPPTLAEAREAVKIVLADRRLGPGMRDSYASQTGNRLTSPSQLLLQGMSFLGSRAKGVDGARQVSRCGEHRCVQLFVRIPGGKWIDTSRIVIDLSARHAAVIGL
ncbi:Tat pathway signal sequence domain protein [Streptomyces malaysiensis]|uniref:Tat pathway signal sequence domain protein n=1 Tax=Streptomyces malaysiensis TaxID=92644 RepID=UPI002B286BDE|nr:Tat pathway signal sequence domain protein [Streptomyces malaysiensis]